MTPRLQPECLNHRLYSGGRVPCTVDADIAQGERAVIAASIVDIEAVSCVRWVPRVNNENPHVRIKKDQAGCFANVGRTTNGVLNLGPGCFVSNSPFQKYIG